MKHCQRICGRCLGMGGSRAISHCTSEFRSGRFAAIKMWAMYVGQFGSILRSMLVAEGRAGRGQVKNVAVSKTFSNITFQNREYHQGKSCVDKCVHICQIWQTCIKMWTCSFPIGDPLHPPRAILRLFV
jgi:hypothetical protein